MRVAPRHAQVYGKDATTTADFLEEVAVSQYALHAGLHLQHITVVWRDLWGHVATQLCTGKGVQLPCLGTIALQSGGVCSQQQLWPVLHLAGSLRQNSNLVAVAYEQVAHRSRLHPSICRRIVQEALLILSQHIDSPCSLQVGLPGVGRLYSEGKASARLEVEQQLVERLALKSPLTRPSSAQILTINHLPRSQYRPDSAAYKSQVVYQPASMSASALQDIPMQASLNTLLRLCTAADTLCTGYVTRLVLEEGLRQHCRQPLHVLPAPALLDLMDAHAAGHSNKFVRYRGFLQGLSLLLADHQVCPTSGAAEADLAKLPAHLKQPADQASKATADEAAAERSAHVSVSAHDEASPPVPLSKPAVQLAPEPVAVSRPQSAHHHASYYLQGQHRGMSRAECDAFNHMHFARLYSAHGKRGVTPKVQQEALTEEEVALLQPAGPVQLHLQPRPDQAVTASSRTGSPRRSASPAAKWQCKAASLEPELQVEKQTRALNLQQGWQQQMQDKDKALQQYEQAEKQWPYSPTRQGHMRVALPPPKHAVGPSPTWDIPAARPGTARVA